MLQVKTLDPACGSSGNRHHASILATEEESSEAYCLLHVVYFLSCSRQGISMAQVPAFFFYLFLLQHPLISEEVWGASHSGSQITNSGQHWQKLANHCVSIKVLSVEEKKASKSS